MTSLLGVPTESGGEALGDTPRTTALSLWEMEGLRTRSSPPRLPRCPFHSYQLSRNFPRLQDREGTAHHSSRCTSPWKEKGESAPVHIGKRGGAWAPLVTVPPQSQLWRPRRTHCICSSSFFATLRLDLSLNFLDFTPDDFMVRKNKSKQNNTATLKVMKVFQQLRRGRWAVPQVCCLTLGGKKQTLLQPVLDRMVQAVHPRPD